MSLQELKPIRWLVGLTRNSPWLMMAIGLHVIVAAVMSVIVIHHERAKANDAATQIAIKPRVEAPREVVQPPEELDRKKIPDNDVQAELVSFEEERQFVPTEEVPKEDLHLDLGDPTGTDDGSDGSTGGTSIGVGMGGHFGTGTPSSLLTRRPNLGRGPIGGRVPRGETQGTEKAVLEGLRWLLRHQNEDGSWGASSVAAHCSKSPCIPADTPLDDSYDVGMTALCLLAFLGQGIAPGSKLEIVDTAMAKRYRAGEAVKQGVRWLCDRQKEDGSFSDGLPFEHPENETLSTMAMCEAYGLSRNRELKRPAQRALDFLVAAQKEGPDGTLSGWGLGSRADIEARHARGELGDEAYEESIGQVDLSITCWVALALRSAQSSGFQVSEDVLAGALNLARASADGIDGADAADPEGKSGRRAAFGMLIRSFVSRDVTDAYLERAAAVIAEDAPRVSRDGLSVDFYYWHFGTLALNQYDGPDSPREGQGEYWDPWNEGLIESLLRLQEGDRGRDVCSRGGWLGASRNAASGRALYNTAMNVLTLEVYYRFENVFGAMPARPR